MFDLAEKEIAIAEAITISDLVRGLPEPETKKVPVFVKALANYIERTSTQNPAAILQEVERCLAESDPYRAFQRLLVHMITIGTAEDVLSIRMYSTGEVARFFGVTVATINNWVNQGRFVGVDKGERFKQVRIPENAVYTAPTGVRTTVSEAAGTYECERARYDQGQPMTKAEELAELANTVVHFEKKYGGPFESTLGSREALTPSEARDAEQWKDLLRAIERRG